MDEHLQQMLGFILITSMFIFCDTFPNDGHWRTMEEDKKSTFTETIEDNMLSLKRWHSKEIGVNVRHAAGEHFSEIDKFHLHKLTGYRNIQHFPGNKIAKLLKININKTPKRHGKVNSKSYSSLIINDANLNETNSTITEKGVTFPRTNVDANDENKVISKVLTLLSPLAEKSEIRRRRSNPWQHRQKRSFFGFDLEKAFEGDTSDVIFGAHTSPCDHADRHYCLNGGTCIFLGALEIKTCRCRIGYTGLRCESINQEFLLALLSEEFFG